MPFFKSLFSRSAAPGRVQQPPAPSAQDNRDANQAELNRLYSEFDRLQRECAELRCSGDQGTTYEAACNRRDEARNAAQRFAQDHGLVDLTADPATLDEEDQRNYGIAFANWRLAELATAAQAARQAGDEDTLRDIEQQTAQWQIRITALAMGGLFDEPLQREAQQPSEGQHAMPVPAGQAQPVRAIAVPHAARGMSMEELQRSIRGAPSGEALKGYCVVVAELGQRWREYEAVYEDLQIYVGPPGTANRQARYLDVAEALEASVIPAVRALATDGPDAQAQRDALVSRLSTPVEARNALVRHHRPLAFRF